MKVVSVAPTLNPALKRNLKAICVYRLVGLTKLLDLKFMPKIYIFFVNS